MTKYQRKAVNSGLSLAMKLGSEMVSAMAIGVGIGYWLDSVFDTTPWLLIIFMILGVAAGFRNLYRAVEPPRDYSTPSDTTPSDSAEKSVESTGKVENSQNEQ